MKTVTIYTDGGHCLRKSRLCPHSLPALREPLGDDAMRRRCREAVL